MNPNFYFLFMSALLWGACTKESVIDDGPETKNVSFSLAVNSLAANDPMSVNQDQTFGSLAIYLYNDDAASTLEQAALLPAFSSTSTKEISVETTAGIKILYVIANYTGPTIKLANGTALTLGPTTTRQQLESITTENSNGFVPHSLLMISKQTLAMTPANNGQTVNVLLRRLQARVDVHIYKGPNLLSTLTTLESVTLYNQVLNSEVKFDYAVNTAQMPTTPAFNNQTIVHSATLLPLTIGTLLQPANAQAVFYTYQNLATSSVQASAPYLEIKLRVAGIAEVRTYKGYFTDANQTANKYSLLPNNVYQVTAVLDVEPTIILNIRALPWDEQNIEYERPITTADFSFGAWATGWGGLNGKTMNTNVGGLEDAVFQFELKAPFGTAWTATLTNGLDFAFTSATAGTTIQAVSSGFTNPGSPSLIAVRASKRWTGALRDTEFYITVEGNEIPINPVTGLQRTYEGTDTRIKIKQVASYN